MNLYTLQKADSISKECFVAPHTQNSKQINTCVARKHC